MSRKGARIAHGSSCRACRRLEWTRDRTRKLVVLADTQKGRATLTDSLGTLLAKTKRRHACQNTCSTPLATPLTPKPLTPNPLIPTSHSNQPLYANCMRQSSPACSTILLNQRASPSQSTSREICHLLLSTRSTNSCNFSLMPVT